MKQIIFILSMIFSMLFYSCKDNNTSTTNELKETVIKEQKIDEELALKKIDSIDSEISKLKNIYYEEEDEFQGVTFLKPKSEKNTYGNTIFCYFSQEGKTTYSPRLVIRYYGDDWIFWKKAVFLVDEETFNFYPEERPKHDSSSSVWEKSDNSMTEMFQEYFSNMINAKSVKYRLQGDNKSRDFSLSKKQIKNIHDMLLLYKLMNERQKINATVGLN